MNKNILTKIIIQLKSWIKLDKKKINTNKYTAHLKKLKNTNTVTFSERMKLKLFLKKKYHYNNHKTFNYFSNLYQKILTKTNKTKEPIKNYLLFSINKFIKQKLIEQTSRPKKNAYNIFLIFGKYYDKYTITSLKNEVKSWGSTGKFLSKKFRLKNANKLFRRRVSFIKIIKKELIKLKCTQLNKFNINCYNKKDLDYCNWTIRSIRDLKDILSKNKLNKINKSRKKLKPLKRLLKRKINTKYLSIREFVFENKEAFNGCKRKKKN